MVAAFMSLELNAGQLMAGPWPHADARAHFRHFGTARTRL
jgi:hypothetical protein